MSGAEESTAGGKTAAWLVPALGFGVITGALGVTSKLALDDLDWREIVVWTAVAYAFVSVPVLATELLQAWPASGLRWGLLSGALAAGALVMLFLALEPGEVSQVVPITSSYPIVTVALAAALLSERVTRRHVAATGLVIVGVILLSVG
jgi:transporter family protein